MCFEHTVTNLMLADPSEGAEYKPLKRKQKRAASISSTLSGGGGTGVDLCWYPAKEFRELSDVQKEELTNWRNSDEEKSVIADGRAKAKAKQAKLSKGGKKEKNGSGDSDPKSNKKYQNLVEKAAKKLLASSLEAEKVEADAMDAQLDAAIQRRGGSDVSATTVVLPNQASVDEDAEKEKAVAEKQTVLKLLSVLSQIKVGKEESTSLGSVESIQRLPLLGNNNDGEQSRIR